ncbi:MAG: rhodanese-like domain-containing protein [bacterium]|nr:rhodanese-like domain-containing protein [bacterium]
MIAGAAAGEGFDEIEPPDLEKVLAADRAPLLLDVRTPEEFSGGHIPGALLIPIDELPNRLDELAAFKERGVVAYCAHGRRATRALELLESAGFQNLRLLAGSMSRWRDETRAENP